jgi:hypothetical protein
VFVDSQAFVAAEVFADLFDVLFPAGVVDLLAFPDPAAFVQRQVCLPLIKVMLCLLYMYWISKNTFS